MRYIRIIEGEKENCYAVNRLVLGKLEEKNGEIKTNMSCRNLFTAITSSCFGVLDLQLANSPTCLVLGQGISVF